MAIVGLGELLWDLFPDGSKVPGGAPFNFAFHCNQLGHEAVIVSRVGADPLGEELRAFVQQSGMSTEFIQVDPNHPTGQVEVVLDAQGAATYRFLAEPAWQFLEWQPALHDLLLRSKALCSGTLAGQGPTAATLRQAEEAIRQANGLVVYDVNLRAKLELDRSRVASCDWLKLNEEEWATLLGTTSAEPDTPASEQLAEKFLHAGQVLIVTRGAEGATLFVPGQGWHRSPALPVQVLDTVGAGDAFTAALLCYRLEGRDWPTSLQFAIHYAGRVCEHRGATPKLDRRDMEAQL